MATVTLPPELVKIIGKIRETLEEVREEPVEPLDSSHEGKEILAMVEDVKKTIGRELSVYQKILGARRYHARIFTFCQHKKGKRQQWARSEIQLAEPEFLCEGVDHLRSLMLDMMRAEEGKALAMWVHPMPGTEHDAFIGFVLHPDGFETAFAIDGGHFIHLPWGEKHRNLALRMVLRRPKSSDKRWAGIIDAQMSVMREELRDDVTGFLGKCTDGMTDELWEEFLELIYLRKEHLMLLQEVARATGVSLVHESQRLIGAMVDLVEKALAAHNEKLAGMEKAHARALKRFKTDLDKYKAGRDVAGNRSRQLEREVQGLRKQLQRAGAGPSAQPEQASQNSIGLALDRFFLEPEHVA